ncbi:hypothetical protein H4S02_000808 [Coemansia sp. RSA 2611]|nr:hypothetical protein H4S02_000808 [Coemansia sp. RSA 2611]
MNATGLTVATTSSGRLPRSMTGLATSPTSPATAAALSLAAGGLLAPSQPVVLTAGQYAVECGGVLIDAATNEVCLLFYPDSSEWRLPMGRPAEMAATALPLGDASAAGCEPPAHAAQRQMSLVTGYRCSHVHPAVTAAAGSDACAYVGPQMVEPLALQIEQRAAPDALDGLLLDAAPDSGAAHNALGLTATEPDPAYQPRACSQFVMTYYYVAWLAQNRFESRAATLPVGPAAEGTAASPARPAPLAEVTWFKMDTAAQVLTNASDKVALRELLLRLTRLPAPAAPLAFAPALAAPPPAARASPVTAPAPPPPPADDVAADSSSAASALSDGATKADNASRNFDIIRRTATSFGKRGGSIFKKQPASDAASADDRQLLASGSSAGAAHPQQPIIVPKRTHVPRVFSIFYKLVGSSSA